jgi:hypothetical protein
MTSGALVLRRSVGGFRCVIGAEVDNNQEGSWSQCYEVLALPGC